MRWRSWAIGAVMLGTAGCRPAESSAVRRPPAPQNAPLPAIDLGTLDFPFDEAHPRLADIPTWLRGLDRQRVTVAGYMVPESDDAVVHRFIIVPAVTYPDPSKLPPAVERSMTAESRLGLEYRADRAIYEGRLHVRVTTDEGYLISLYSLDVERVISPTPPQPPRPTGARHAGECRAAGRQRRRQPDGADHDVDRDGEPEDAELVQGRIGRHRAGDRRGSRA